MTCRNAGQQSSCSITQNRQYCSRLQSETQRGVIFTARRYALSGLCNRNSVCPSICLPVSLVDCVHSVRPTIMISSPCGSPIILVSADIRFIPKFEGGHSDSRARELNKGGVGTNMRFSIFKPPYLHNGAR